MIQTKVVDKIKTYILCSVTFSPENVEKYGRAKHATDDNMAHAHYMLDT
jgi:hypothetical protein